jgi:hypothetical protein
MSNLMNGLSYFRLDIRFNEVDSFGTSTFDLQNGSAIYPSSVVIL